MGWRACLPAQALGSGILNKEKADFLGEVRDKMGLSKEAAEKIIKGVQNQHVISGLQVRHLLRIAGKIFFCLL